MSNLYIDRKGTELKLSGEALVCYENGERIGTIPLAPIERIYLKGDVTLQASLLAKLGERDIGVICLSGRKNQPTLFVSSPHNDAKRRLTQYDCAQNEAFCLAFAQKLVAQKVSGQKNWLAQVASTRPDKRLWLAVGAEELALLQDKISLQTSLPSLSGIEGRASAVYFNALGHYLPPALKFDGRNRRPPRDPFNAMLSLAYTLLHSEAVLATYGAGLDPYVGFYHSLDYGRESLACDLIEPLRPLVDRWLIDCFSEEILRVEHFSNTNEGCFLGKAGRVHFYQAYEKQVAIWRKTLDEQCAELVRILGEQTIGLQPQRRSNVVQGEWCPI